MEDLLPAKYLALVPMVVALVAMLRNRFPKIDGHEVVIGVSALLSVGLCFLTGGDTPANLVKYGIEVALAAAGGMQALKYHATKSGEATATTLSFPPPAKVPSIGPQRGLARFEAFVFVGVLGFVGLIYACAGITKQDIKTVVDITKELVEETCSPADPTLDACIDKLLSSPKYKAALAAKKPPALDGGR